MPTRRHRIARRCGHLRLSPRRAACHRSSTWFRFEKLAFPFSANQWKLPLDRPLTDFGLFSNFGNTISLDSQNCDFPQLVISEHFQKPYVLLLKCHEKIGGGG